MEMRRFRAIQNPRPKAVIMTCVDLRFEEAFEGLPGELGLAKGEFVHMQIAGGPAPLAYPLDMEDRFKYLAKQVKFKCRKFHVARAIFVSHEDCAYYEECPEFLQGPEKEKRDLAKVGGHMELWLPGYKVELYHAKLVNHGREIDFEEVPICSEKVTIDLEWTKKSYQNTRKSAQAHH